MSPGKRKLEDDTENDDEEMSVDNTEGIVA